MSDVTCTSHLHHLPKVSMTTSRPNPGTRNCGLLSITVRRSRISAIQKGQLRRPPFFFFLRRIFAPTLSTQLYSHHINKTKWPSPALSATFSPPSMSSLPQSSTQSTPLSTLSSPLSWVSSRVSSTSSPMFSLASLTSQAELANS